ncbi:hypothetical protein GIB67_028599 [Kingdonia uniflora]|uniref:Uncharacterized protein n=1 Tax=Kingdonia uniflora TaxID=39325 RepID=A0A7J7KZG6_9MAGN|nr:hypothetical protein GIB67_028599 [Kingdonia uniflora]
MSTFCLTTALPRFSATFARRSTFSNPRTFVSAFPRPLQASVQQEVSGAYDKAGHAIKQGKNEINKTAENVKEKACSTAGDAKEKASSTAEQLTEKAMDMANKVSETAQDVTEKAKQSVQESWGSAKDTTQKIKDTVVGKAEETAGKEAADEIEGYRG